MRAWPAQKDQQLIVAVFISVILILLIGSAIYKYGYTDVSEEETDLYQTIIEDIQPAQEAVRPTVILTLQPTDKAVINGVEYQLMVAGPGLATTGISVKLLADGATTPIEISEVTPSQTISNGPWQVLINKTGADAVTKQPSLQFAITSNDAAKSLVDNDTLLGTFVVNSDQPVQFQIAEDSLLTTDGQAYDLILGNN